MDSLTFSAEGFIVIIIYAAGILLALFGAYIEYHNSRVSTPVTAEICGEAYTGPRFHKVRHVICRYTAGGQEHRAQSAFSCGRPIGRQIRVLIDRDGKMHRNREGLRLLLGGLALCAAAALAGCL